MHTCQFCLRRRINHETEEGYLLCDQCYSSLEEVKKNQGRSPLEITPKDPSTLCIRCGLCCVLLAAKVEEEEVQPFLDTARIEGLGNYTYEDFAYKVKGGPFSGETLINMPCKFLKGRVLQYVNCAAYSIDRPRVCGGYLCKIAIKYKIGLISLEEAAYELRGAFDQGDLSVFNWTHDDVEEEERLQLFSEVARASQFLRDQGRTQEEVNLIVLSRMTPAYVVKSAQHQALFRMHLYRVDRDDFDPLLFFEPEEIASWQPAAAEFAELVIRRVMQVVRSYFINVEAAVLAEEATKQREKENDEDGDQEEGREEGEGEQGEGREDDGAGGQGGDGPRGCDPGEGGEREEPAHPEDQQDEHPPTGDDRGTGHPGEEAEGRRTDHLKPIAEVDPELAEWLHKVETGERLAEITKEEYARAKKIREACKPYSGPGCPECGKPPPDHGVTCALHRALAKEDRCTCDDSGHCEYCRFIEADKIARDPDCQELTLIMLKELRDCRSEQCVPVTKDDLKCFAEDLDLSLDEARAMAKAEGIVIEGEDGIKE